MKLKNLEFEIPDALVVDVDNSLEDSNLLLDAQFEEKIQRFEIQEVYKAVLPVLKGVRWLLFWKKKWQHALDNFIKWVEAKLV